MSITSLLRVSEAFLLLGLHGHRKACSSVAPSAPTLAFVPACPPVDPKGLQKLQEFLSSSQRLFVLTGAGISTESGIPDYRSEGVGLYARTDRRPVQHAEFLRSAKARQKYWARNFVGWTQFSCHRPNVAHLALRSWEQVGKLHWLVTQNVDALHAKAGSQRLTELHGCSHRVLCLSCGDQTSRADLQERFQALNPTWHAEALGVAPDGDVFLSEEQVRTFCVPSCDKCGGPLKPDVTFFGDTVCKEKVDFVYQRLAESDAVLNEGGSWALWVAPQETKGPHVAHAVHPTVLDRGLVCVSAGVLSLQVCPRRSGPEAADGHREHRPHEGRSLCVFEAELSVWRTAAFGQPQVIQISTPGRKSSRKGHYYRVGDSHLCSGKFEVNGEGHLMVTLRKDTAKEEGAILAPWT
ncbi:hypothetical protein JD844_015011 [Phrynosoma platyrhinos]|uniref:Deacetylase sirtuin-type domain-containing protein n=1 Tax=Phrynosoma platyrhinos TaxID=52577 RepID=A0ABQ7T751_PHRPL|nr:hypothetical protein JD844_015011 [Phrynosoma platyrhinos]